VVIADVPDIAFCQYCVVIYVFGDYLSNAVCFKVGEILNE